MWFLPRNRPPLFYRWCIATILCVLKPYNVPSIAGCETTSRNVLSQKCMMFWCQSTSPGRLQYSRQAGEVLVKFQFQFVPYRSVFKTHKCCTSPNQSHRISQSNNQLCVIITLRPHNNTKLCSFFAALCLPPNLSFIFLYILYFQFHFYGLLLPTGKESLPQNCLHFS